MNELLLLSGGMVPFPEAQVSIHQPTLKEIAFIGETGFFHGCELLRFSKNMLSQQDKDNLANQTDFDIIMSIMNDKKDVGAQSSAISARMLLTLMFPDYQIQIRNDHIALIKSDNKEFVDDNVNEFHINNKNYDAFRKILIDIFCLHGILEKEYNPHGDLSQRIADKLRSRKSKLNEDKPQQKISVFSRYASILAVGERKDLNALMNYTVYQLNDEFQRYQLKINYDLYMQAKMAGTKDLEEVDNWTKDIHEDE